MCQKNPKEKKEESHLSYREYVYEVHNTYYFFPVWHTEFLICALHLQVKLYQKGPLLMLWEAYSCRCQFNRVSTH